MPDKITQEEQDQLEKRRRQAAKVDWNKIAQWKAPDVKYAWVDPPKQDKYEPRVAPLPNDNGQTPEVVRLPFDPSKPDQNQRMPYLIDRESATQTEQSKDQNSASIAPKQRIPEWMQQQKAQEITPPARFDYASPLSKGLAKILSISNENPREADRLRGFVQQSAKDPDSPYWRPYARPTNNVPMQELQKLGVDTSNLNRDWFEKNAWLKKYVRVGTSGLPMPPKDDSSKEEKAAYYYTRLMDAQNTTDRAEMELTGLKREIGYWANRKDRNYSDGEVLSRIEWRNYPTLSLLRADGQQGLPTEVNKAIDFDDDTELGMLWSARNKKTSSSHTMDAARYALGEGITYQPDDVVRAMRDPGSPAYHPYALGSTVDEPAQYFGVDAFDKTWLQKNRHILDSGNKTAKFMYNTVYDAERFTRQAEAELKDLTGTVNAKLDQAFAWGKADGEGILRDAYANYPALRRMDEGRSSGKLPLLTRPLIYRYEDIAAQVQKQADILGKRMGSTHNSNDLQAAAQNEKAAEIAAQGSALQLDIAPKSRTARKNLLWEDGLLAGVSPSMQGVGFPLTEEGVVSAAAKGILRTALSGEDEAENQQAQAGISRMADMLLNIKEEAAGKIASFFGAVTGKDTTARSGTAGLVSLIVETGADVLGTITKRLLEEEDHSLPFLQTLSGLLRLRRAATGEETEVERMTGKALAGAVAGSLSGVQVKTGNTAFDGIATVAAQSGSSVEMAQKRWGNAGVNYFANLTAAGRGDVAAILQTLPSYAKSMVVAEQNMRTMALTPGKLYSQLMALKQDLLSPEITQNAIRRGRLQAESALISQKVAGGALGGLQGLQKEVDDAKAQSDKNQSALDQAKKKEQAVTTLHAAASTKFLSNLADTAATNGLLSVLDQWQAAKEKRKQAEQNAADSQNTLASAQQKLTDKKQRTMADLEAEIKKDVDQKVQAAIAMTVSTGELPPHVRIFNETAKHEPFSLAPDAGISIIKGQSSGREADGIPEEQQSVPPGDLLSAVMAPERLQTLQEINDQFWDLLTDEEKQKIDNGMSIFLIIPTLDQERQQKIVQWEQIFLSSLDEQQKNDLMFLGSGLLDGRDLATRQAILGRLKENDGVITYEDLVDIGVFEPGTLSENGFVRWLQNIGGGPDVFADMLETEYRLNNEFGMTFGMADQEYRKQLEAQRAMAVTLLIAPAIGSLADRMINGSAKGDYANNAYDNLERQGTTESSRGSDFSWNPPEGTSQKYYAAKSAGWKRQDGTPWWPDNHGFDGVPEKTTLQPGIRIDRYGNEKGTFTSPEGTPFDQRALAPGSENSPYNTYEVIKPFDVNAGKASSWFDQPGGGTQYQLPMSVEELRILGYIRIIAK